MWGTTDAFAQLMSHYYQLTPWYNDAQFTIACRNNMLLGIQLCTDLVKGVRGRRVVFCGRKDVLPIVQKNLKIFPEILFINVFPQDDNFLDVAKLLRDMK